MVCVGVVCGEVCGVVEAREGVFGVFGHFEGV